MAREKDSLLKKQSETEAVLMDLSEKLNESAIMFESSQENHGQKVTDLMMKISTYQEETLAGKNREEELEKEISK